MNKKIIEKLGFTLVEMLVVISIIGILSAVLAGGYVNSQRSARDATRKLNLKSISDALNTYYADFGEYPTTVTIETIIDSETELKKNDVIYIKKMPKEKNESLKQIKYVSTGKSFKLYTNLENDDDKDCKTCSDYMDSSDDGCCFAITSSNTSLEGEMP